MRVELTEFQYGELLRRAFIVKGAGIADLALEQFQIGRVERKLQAGLRRGGSGVDCAASIERPFVNKERALKLNLAAKPAAIALSALVSFVTIDEVVRQNIREYRPAQCGPRMN